MTKVIMPLNPVTKQTFKKWHKEGNLLLLTAGYAEGDILLDQLSDINVDWQAAAKPVSRHDVDGTGKSIYMVSNGCDEFVLVRDTSYLLDGKPHFTVYVVKDMHLPHARI